MNNLGWTLAWLSFQVALLLAPALALQALVSRRGSVAGAWLATWSLGLVLALGMAAFLPDLRPVAAPMRPAASVAVTPMESGSPVESAPLAKGKAAPRANGRRLSLAGWGKAWDRLSPRVAAPVAIVQPWGWAFASVALAGITLGLLRLCLGLWAIGVCRRRGTSVDDSSMVGLVEEIRAGMGCRRPVEIVEVSDLSTPATAGWRRPMLLLPAHWRAWRECERRAVVAHELAHVVRGDYATGLLARIVVALHFHHPMVRWMAWRLHLEQELAADALGARFAGGRSSYLLALSRLALEEEGRPANWPARAFLPARGTLIRRIAMLKDRTESTVTAVAWSKSLRVATALSLLALTAGVASWKAPARAADDGPSPAPAAASTKAAGTETVTPFELAYIPDKMIGVVAVRPAAIARRSGMNALTPMLETMLADDIALVARVLKVDTTRPGFVKLRCEDIESIAAGIDFGRAGGGAKNADGQTLHSLQISGVTVRTVVPFDWLAYFRQWKVDLEEFREPRGVYYKIKDRRKAELMLDCVFYLADDRTVVFDAEDSIKSLIARDKPSAPAYLRGADWEKASRELVAVAFNNEADAFVKRYDLGRPDDAAVLAFYKGIDRWVFSLADSDSLTPHLAATARDPQSAESVARAIGQLVKLGRETIDSAPPAAGDHDRAIRLAKGLLGNLKVGSEGRSVLLSAKGFGTFADLASILRAEINAASARVQTAGDEPKTEKR